uniref:C2H2-type domain-containing protein n=1 Tax=Panagrellus redivivus TaxID=6233 RepID=A0A7E4VFV0_PANRE
MPRRRSRRASARTDGGEQGDLIEMHPDEAVEGEMEELQHHQVGPDGHVLVDEGQEHELMEHEMVEQVHGEDELQEYHHHHHHQHLQHVEMVQHIDEETGEVLEVVSDQQVEVDGELVDTKNVVVMHHRHGHNGYGHGEVVMMEGHEGTSAGGDVVVDVDGEGPIAVDDDAPPLLVPQKVAPDEQEQHEQEAHHQEYIIGEDNQAYYIDGEGGATIKTDDGEEGYIVDSANVCCGICGEVMPYELLMSAHLPNSHPEILADGEPDFEEVSYDVWLKDRNEKYTDRYEEDSFYEVHQTSRSSRPIRRVSQIRVKTSTMSVEELEASLRKKMVEKLGRSVPVTLVDKQHARCGYCNAVVSLNKKFEIVHLVRHFNAWHPSAHKCAGHWGKIPVPNGYGKPLSANDIAVIDTLLGAHDNLQCIWCGMFMDGSAVGMHFHEVHPDEIEVPKCNLCLQEVLINARLTERYNDRFDVVMPDERHFKCLKYDTSHSSESALEKSIVRFLHREQNGGVGPSDDEDDVDDTENQRNNQSNYSNSRMSFGRRSKPKRHFVMPSLRQAVPTDSGFVEPVTDCHWKCKLCGKDILAAVISAGTIRHYRDHHPERLNECQMELCKTRLERLSDGCMEFLNPNEIECLICQMTYPLHKPFNMCRAVRHLKAKHPAQMPEYEGTSQKSEPVSKKRRIDREVPAPLPLTEDVTPKYQILDENVLKELREKYEVEFTKVLDVRTTNGDQVFVLVNGEPRIDQQAIEQVLMQVEASEPQYDGTPYVVQYAPHSPTDDEVHASQQPQRQQPVPPVLPVESQASTSKPAESTTQNDNDVMIKGELIDMDDSAAYEEVVTVDEDGQHYIEVADEEHLHEGGEEGQEEQIEMPELDHEGGEEEGALVYVEEPQHEEQDQPDAPENA